jgi:SAM-dependent methyltransferase
MAHDVRGSYDRVAPAYARQFAGELAHKPLDRALLGVLADEARGRGPALDVGCGPGHVAAHLRGLGVDAAGLDLSPGMVDAARALHPGVPFEVGDLRALGPRELAAVTAMYAVCNLPPAELPAAAASLAGALRPGGLLLVGFHSGHDGPDQVHLAEWYGERVDVDFWFHPADAVAGALATAGLVVEARLERRAYPQEYASRRAYLLARRPADLG